MDPRLEEGLAAFAGTVFVRTLGSGLSVSMHADVSLMCWREGGLLQWGGWLMPHSSAGAVAVLEDDGRVEIAVGRRRARALCEACPDARSPLKVTGSGEPPFEHQFGP